MVHASTHPLIAHKLSKLREKDTIRKEFRELADEITMLLAYEGLRDLQLQDYNVETPLCFATGQRLYQDIVIVPILRAGVGMLDGLLKLLPNARVGFVGLYRDHDTKEPVAYYDKLPEGICDPTAVIVDPMLATGGSICATIEVVKAKGYERIKLITIISSPEGIEVVQKAHPDVDIITGSIDEHLDEHKYIIPGLGDAGDRLFGTR